MAGSPTIDNCNACNLLSNSLMCCNSFNSYCVIILDFIGLWHRPSMSRLFWLIAHVEEIQHLRAIVRRFYVLRFKPLKTRLFNVHSPYYNPDASGKHKLLVS